MWLLWWSIYLLDWVWSGSVYVCDDCESHSAAAWLLNQTGQINARCYCERTDTYKWSGGVGDRLSSVRSCHRPTPLFIQSAAAAWAAFPTNWIWLNELHSTSITFYAPIACGDRKIIKLWRHGFGAKIYFENVLFLSIFMITLQSQWWATNHTKFAKHKTKIIKSN